MSDFAITPFRINGINKLVGMNFNLYGKEYTITGTKSSQSPFKGLLGYGVVITNDTKSFYLNIDFTDGKVELWEISNHLPMISKNLHKRDFENIPKFIHLSRYLLIEYFAKHSR